MFVSIIIPTHNRRVHILRAVEALMTQDYPRVSYEVIVCCDRCTDGTEHALRERFDNQIELAKSVMGQSGALNTGWRRACGELAIFLDDEMEATVGLISAHVHAHQAMTTAKVAVTGYSPVVVTKASPPLMQKTANEYEKYFFELGRKDRKPTPLDLCGSNFSVPVSTLNEVNGFDETYFFQRIDFELAVRLIERGYDIRFSRDARADMHLAVTEDDLIDRASARAKNDWRLAVQYPWCAPYLPFFRAVRDPATQLRWQLLWKTADIVAPIFSKLRKVAPRSVRLMSWEYATRYCMALGEAAGNWHSLCSVANRGEAKE